MINPVALISLLHEPDTGSAARVFRGQPVLRWTLQRLSRARRLGGIGILCWEDQARAVNAIAGAENAVVMCKGARVRLPELQAVTAARHWADGWRGGLLGTCHFDVGFHGPSHLELLKKMSGDAAVLIDPGAGLIDPALVDGLVEHAEAQPANDLCFLPAGPGLGAVLLTVGQMNRLVAAGMHPGRLMHYHPDLLSAEPLASTACVPVPTAVARTPHRFDLNSDRQLRRIESATASLNGQLMGTGAEELVRRIQADSKPDLLPREIVLELNTRRATRPIFWPGQSLPIDRPDLTLELARTLIEELAASDDTRLTLAGVGDPLLSAHAFEILDLAAAAPQVHVHVETDLLDLSAEQIQRLAQSRIDVISIHLPALSQHRYAAIMGRDGYKQAIDNFRMLLSAKEKYGTSIPVVVPIFMKCQANFEEMEAWYDQWLRAVGSAVIRGPSDCGGQIPDVSVADMAPAGRRPCERINSRMTLLSDGRIVSCEEDVLGQQTIGHLGRQPLSVIWQRQFESLREEHRAGKWNVRPLCGKCREWHRP